MKIYESAENYLETILMLKNKNGMVRSIDIAHELSFTKPSVSVAMKNFREEGYIIVNEEGYIHLTEKGLDIAEKIYERHQTLTTFFMSIGVDKETAAADSCKIEHHLSEKSYQKIKEHLGKLQHG